jgi:integrase/recombinase XerD
MTALAPTLQAFFTERLIRQRHASTHTVAAYRDTMRLLLGYVAEHGEPPRFRIPDPIRSGPERRMINARTA